MTVWCLFDYRELDAIYATKEAAEAALTAAKGDHTLTFPDGRELTGYHIEEWQVEQ
jgi:hypothetical protein